MQVIVAKMQHVGAREAAAEALSDAALLRLDKHSASVLNTGAAVMMDCLMEFAFSPGGLEDGLEVPRRDEEDAEAQARGGWS